MPPPISPNAAHKTERFKPLFNPDFSSARESHETQSTDSRDHSGFALKDSQEPSLQKLENKRSTPDPLDDFLKKQQDEDLPYVLSPAPGPMISVNPYINQSKLDEFLEFAQTPLVSTSTVQKGMQLLAKTQPPSLMLDQLSDQLDSQKINNPIKPLREGFSQGIAETLSSFSSPQNITLASATLMLSATPAEPYLGTAFTTALVPVVANSVKETMDAARQGDLKEVGRHVAHTMIGGVGLWVTAKGYLEKGKIDTIQSYNKTTPVIQKPEIISNFIETSRKELSLNNLDSLKGASVKDIQSLIPKDWIQQPLKKGEGVKFLNPKKPGEAIMLERGFPLSQDPLHQGPYVRISKDGIITRIPLEKNPVLKK